MTTTRDRARGVSALAGRSLKGGGVYATKRLLRAAENRGVAHNRGLSVSRPSDRVRDLANAYVAQVRGLPFVREVFLVRAGAVPAVWTILDAEPFEYEPRRQLHEARFQAMEQTSGVTADFRLINPNERERWRPEEELPPDAERVFVRQP